MDSYEKLKDASGKLLFDIITDIPESVLPKAKDPKKRSEKLTGSAALKAAAVSATLSVPGGFAGILTMLPDIVTIWKIQTQLVSDIAATYGKYAELSREAMMWCMFRHSASQLLRDTFVQFGARVVTQTISINLMTKLLGKLGAAKASAFVGKALTRAVPLIGAIGSGAYAFYDTREVGRTAETYFRALAENGTGAELASDDAEASSEVEGEVKGGE